MPLLQKYTPDNPKFIIQNIGGAGQQQGGELPVLARPQGRHQDRDPAGGQRPDTSGRPSGGTAVLKDIIADP